MEKILIHLLKKKSFLSFYFVLGIILDTGCYKEK